MSKEKATNRKDDPSFKIPPAVVTLDDLLVAARFFERTEHPVVAKVVYNPPQANQFGGQVRFLTNQGTQLWKTTTDIALKMYANYVKQVKEQLIEEHADALRDKFKQQQQPIKCGEETKSSR